MIHLTKRQVQDLGHRHSPAVRHAVVSAGKFIATGELEISLESFRLALRSGPETAPVISRVQTAKVAVAAPKAAVPFQAVAESEWPLWARAISKLKSDPDLGVGDTVARIIGPATSAAFKAWHLATFGQACGCTRRQAEWNARFPYPPAPQNTPNPTPKP